MTHALSQAPPAARSSRGARTGWALALATGLTAVGVATGPAAQAVPLPSCLDFDSTTQSTATGVMSCEVPAGVTALHVVSTGAGGAGGGGVATASTGGAGAKVTVDVAVTPGEVLTLQVGTGGATSGSSLAYGGGGGGWTAVLRGSTVLVVAGGGGGGGGLDNNPFNGAGYVMAGGSGGTPVGGNGTPSGVNVAHPADNARAGFGATASAAGVGGAGNGGSGVTGSSQAGGRGGGAGGAAGSTGGSTWQGGTPAGLNGGGSSGGGGGSGWFGGGGGGTAYRESGSAGGGSSYVAAGSATYAAATNGGASRTAGGSGRLQLSGVAPTIASISPATGSSSGGTSVTVTGADFGSGTTVTVGGQACTAVVVASSTSLTCTTPAHPSGAVDVVVTSGGQSATLAGGFTYAVDVPGAPTGVTATAGTSSVTVTWAAPTTGGPVQRYEVRTAQGQAVCTTTTTSCVLGGTAGTAYDVVVVAIGTAGSSLPATGTSGPVTSPVVPTSVPTSAPLTLTTDKGQITTAAAGQEIVVLGSGFAPYSTATIVIYSSPTVLGTVVTDGSGAFSKPVTVPRTLAAGTHNLVASGVDPSGAERTMRMEVQVAAMGGGTSTLANTGYSAGLSLGLGALLLTGGAGLLWAGRRRTA